MSYACLKSGEAAELYSTLTHIYKLADSDASGREARSVNNQ